MERGKGKEAAFDFKWGVKGKRVSMLYLYWYNIYTSFVFIISAAAAEPMSFGAFFGFFWLKRGK